MLIMTSTSYLCVQKYHYPSIIKIKKSRVCHKFAPSVFCNLLHHNHLINETVSHAVSVTQLMKISPFLA